MGLNFKFQLVQQAYVLSRDLRAFPNLLQLQDSEVAIFRWTCCQS